MLYGINMDEIFTTHRVIEIKAATLSLSLLRVEKADIKFNAGQHLPLRLLREPAIRDFTIYSSIYDSFIEFLIRHNPNDKITQQLLALKPDDFIELGEAAGVMTVDPRQIKKRMHWFIATGTGVAPFHSVILSYRNLNYRLIHGMRTIDDAFDSDNYSPDKYVRCVSRGPGGDFYGHVTSYIEQQKTPVDDLYYISGNMEMVFEVSQLLRQREIDAENIRSDQL
ncbi:hypothetical protein JW960_23375 [candidate division KSB1 bacterium]|nr:hypothetical protein [candidate division KSB1 bacterium]